MKTHLIRIAGLALCLFASPALTLGSESLEGYNLFTALDSTTAYLMDNDGNFVHSWAIGYRPGHSMYLLESGELLTTGRLGNTTFNAGGAGGIIRTFDWDGNVTWEYQYSSSEHLQHHDIEMLPDGNVLMIAWQHKTAAEAIAAGRNPSQLRGGALWPDSIIEVEPTGTSGGNIVWEWHVWDHLVQDYDPTKDNYGVVADHPELIDLNFIYRDDADWTHCNAVDYNAELDQIVISVRFFSEIWIIDHSTTTAEAASHSGGNSGMGGDLLYRWGNPRTYDAGTTADQKLFAQHDAEWIEDGLPGEGNIIIFNNGYGRSGADYSSIEEIVPPLNADDSYALTAGSAYGPDEPIWNYTADPATSFYSQNISSQQRLKNGNTLICSGWGGYFFEVTAAGETVWEYDYNRPTFRVERYAPNYAGFDGTPLDDDSVGDGIPDAWRAEHFGGDGTTTTPESEADADPDGDGCDNLCEYLADTDPNDPLSRFVAAVTPGDDTVAVSFQSSDERVYTLWRSVDLSEGSWETVDGQIDVAGSGGADSLVDSNPPDDQCFYRVEVAVP